MCFLNAIRLQAYPPRRIVKIGDTLADITEGLNAGMWTVGVILSGNEVGLSKEEVGRLDAEDKAARIQKVEKRFRAAGAHYTAESVTNCRDVLARIEERIVRGEQPAREKSHGREE
jgi:phosphonoacetaldehyde hydrolase